MKYRLHKAFKPRKHLYLIPHGVSLEETSLASSIQSEFPRLKMYRSDRQILNGKEIDLYIPYKKIGIEYNGNRYHSSAMDKTKYYHLNKTVLAESKDVKIIHIFSDMYEQKKGIVIDYIKKILGKYQTIDMKKCSIEKLSNAEAKYFLNNSTINGLDYRATDFIGIIYNGDVVAVLQYSKSAIYGYHDIKGYKINNGLKSILEEFPNLKDLKVYTDRGLLENLEWESIGYKKTSCTEPRLYYTKDFKNRILSDNIKLTESEKQSLYTIYDCGEIILTFK